MDAPKNIYRHTAWLYDVEYEKEQPLPDIPFYLEYAEKFCGANGGEILELGCGTGRVALALAKAGFCVTGLDLSNQMLDIFKNKLKRQPDFASKVEIFHGSMANFNFGKKFTLITAPFRAFQAVTEQADIESTLACVRGHLADGGIFIVNVFRPYAEPLDESWVGLEVFDREFCDEESGVRVMRYECREKIDAVNQVIYPYLAYEVAYPDGKYERLVEPLRMKYYYRCQLRAEIEKAGLSVSEEFSWYDKSPPEGREIILVCKKQTVQERVPCA